MNIRELNSLMTSHDIKNRLPRGRRSVNEGLVHQVKSMVDPQYDSLDIYGKVMSSESRESVLIIRIIQILIQIIYVSM